MFGKKSGQRRRRLLREVLIAFVGGLVAYFVTIGLGEVFVLDLLCSDLCFGCDDSDLIIEAGVHDRGINVFTELSRLSSGSTTNEVLATFRKCRGIVDYCRGGSACDSRCVVSFARGLFGGRNRQFVEQGRLKDAIDDLFLLRHVDDMMSSNGASFEDRISGLELDAIILEYAERVLWSGRLTEDDAARLDCMFYRRVDSRDWEKACWDVVRSDYAELKARLADRQGCRQEIIRKLKLYYPDFKFPWLFSVYARFAFQPNRTLRLAAGRARRAKLLLDDVAKVFVGESVKAANKCRSYPDDLKWWEPNCVGKEIVDSADYESIFRQIVESRCRDGAFAAAIEWIRTKKQTGVAPLWSDKCDPVSGQPYLLDYRCMMIKANIDGIRWRDQPHIGLDTFNGGHAYGLPTLRDKGFL